VLANIYFRLLMVQYLGANQIM